MLCIWSGTLRTLHILIAALFNIIRYMNLTVASSFIIRHLNVVSCEI